MTVALLLGLVHAVTDLATVTAMVRATGLHADTAGAVFAWFLVYDVVAFAGQPFIGVVADRLRAGPVVLVGLGLTGGAVVVASLGGGPTVTAGLVAVVLAGLGNAVTHVGAGVAVLRGDLTRATPAGLLVAPGALGLGLGLWFGRDPGLGATWWPAVPLAGAAAVVVHLHRAGRLAVNTSGARPDPELPGATGTSTDARTATWSGERLLDPPARRIAATAVGLLLVSVAIRSLVGASAGRGYDAGAWLAVGLPLVACAGKGLGGVVADRLGWLPATVGALLASLPLLAVQHAHPVGLLAGLLIFQTTMPVTLVAVGRLMPGHPGTAFGLPCAALLVGSLPAAFSWSAPLADRPVSAAWIVVSAGAVCGGLRLMGLRWRRSAPVRRPGEPTRVPVVSVAP